MGSRARLALLLSLVVGMILVGVAACAQLQDLDKFEKVDCLDDCDAGNDVVVPTEDVVAPADVVTEAWCPPCSGATPYCDPATLKCVECLPTMQGSCPVGQFCDPAPDAGYACAQGCATVNDCLAVIAQADAGDAGDAGGDARADARADGGDAGALTVACCNNRCVDTSSDSRHCGQCGNQCNTSSACCNSACIDVTSTATSCGGCGQVCSGNHVPSPSCGARACNGACAPGWGDCNVNKLTDGCESDIYNDPDRCGSCSNVCSANHMSTRTCSVGNCDGTCAAGFADCNNNKLVDGCESNLLNDANHCGGCPNVCSNNHITTPTCGSGSCNGTCDANYADCNNNKLVDGCETNVMTTATACGGCGRVCSNNHVPTPTCANGACNGTCQGGYMDCNTDKLSDGCETYTDGDPNHCGNCVNVCSSNHMSTRTCGGGVCNGTCAAGYADCNNNKLTDGCETSILTDPNNCGGCFGAGGTKCAAGTPCVNGTCGCPAGFTASNGKCQRTYDIQLADLQNQGASCGTLVHRYDGCGSADYGFTWTDVGPANGLPTVSAVSVQFYAGINCMTAPMTQSVKLNGTVAGSYLEGADYNNRCLCDPIVPVVESVNLNVATYAAGGANTMFIVQAYPFGCIGFSPNAGWAGAFARVTVTY